MLTPPAMIRRPPMPNPTHGNRRRMRDEAKEKRAPITPKRRVNARATTALTASDRRVRDAKVFSVLSSFRYRPRYAGSRAKPQGLNAATMPRKKAYTHQRPLPAPEVRPLIAEEIRSTKITGVAPSGEERSPAVTAKPSTNTVTAAAQIHRRDSARAPDRAIVSLMRRMSEGVGGAA
jgi:hypothetical protein